MTPAQLITFARGAPSVDIVDIAGLKAAAIRAFDTDSSIVTPYGASTGYPPLRAWIAAKHGVPVEHVLITNGSLQADAFVFEHLIKPGDDVIVEKPTYDRTLLNLLKQLQAKVHQVTVNDDGIDTGELRKLLESGVRPRIAHIIPNYQNPAGVTLSLQKRHELLGLAAEYGFTIFEDDPYIDIRFRGEALPSMLSLAPSVPGAAEAVVHASSFTKTVCPGVRIGYLVASPSVINPIAARATSLYISAGQVSQGIVYQFCVVGDLDKSIATVSAALGERARLLAESLRRHVPDARFTEPDGGYFLWVDLPDDVHVDKLVPAGIEHGVAVVKGSDFLLEGGEHSLRLAFSGVTDDQIDEGVRRLAEAIAAVRG
ncbi:DNA-binding transcriptional MocR family regulator [Allocatelliglobosispora scoriae]|uniref:DNA-binding transcriptional MocR family regulator n=1 Tax=Allocatelliglobosispora scoriae TaxID=643052 RepID=A0A841BSC8_9ACTN|nr:PLP-dependent aminotransferase family protein [Allocatelliglobosispora scoriae]MBB5871134.1 DNA-binding transcriptional MocR family regulator [Allocatelliglobosispora scoriae]